jgi:hypothetical protein
MGHPAEYEVNRFPDGKDQEALMTSTVIVLVGKTR